MNGVEVVAHDDQVAVIPAYIVYTDGAESYCWNDQRSVYCDSTFDSRSLTHGVVIFSLNRHGEKLLEYLSNPPQFPNRSEPAQVIPAKRARSTLALDVAVPSKVPAADATRLLQYPCNVNDHPSQSSTDSADSAVIKISQYTAGPSSELTHFSGTTTESDYDY
jgi:hypothetical protein